MTPRQDQSDRDVRVKESLRNMKRLTVAAQAAVAPVWLQLDLTMAQLKGLFALARHREIPIGQLASALGIGEPSTSLLVDRLVRAELAVRNEDAADRRRTLTSLSPRGEDLVAELRHGGRKSMERWLARLDQADLDALARGLGALADAAEADARRDHKSGGQ